MEKAMDPSVIELLDYLKGAEMSQAAEKMESVLKYVNVMEEKLDEMIGQVEGMRNDLKRYEYLQNRSLGEKVKDKVSEKVSETIAYAKDLLEKTWIRLRAMKNAVRKVKERFEMEAAETLSMMKSRGKQALNKLLEFTHARQILEDAKERMEVTIKEADQMIERLEKLGSELREAKQKRNNAFRSFAGKEEKVYDNEKQPILAAISTMPWKNHRKSCEDSIKLLDKGISKLQALAKDVAEFEKSLSSKMQGMTENAEKEFEGQDFDQSDPGKVIGSIGESLAETGKVIQYGDEAFEQFMQEHGNKALGSFEGNNRLLTEKKIVAR